MPVTTCTSLRCCARCFRGHPGQCQRGHPRVCGPGHQLARRPGRPGPRPQQPPHPAVPSPLRRAQPRCHQGRSVSSRPDPEPSRPATATAGEFASNHLRSRGCGFDQFSRSHCRAWLRSMRSVPHRITQTGNSHGGRAETHSEDQHHEVRTEGFTEEERDAMKERARELKASARGGKVDEETAVLEKIAELPDHDRAMAERIHPIIKENAPELRPSSGTECPPTTWAARTSASSRAQPSSSPGTRPSASTDLAAEHLRRRLPCGRTSFSPDQASTPAAEKQHHQPSSRRLVS